MLNTSIYIVFALLLIDCSLLLLLVLMQRPKQEGLGASFGAQMTDQVFGSQTSDVLKKGTVFFGALFFILCFALSILMNARFQKSKSDLPTLDQAQIEAKAAVEEKAKQDAAAKLAEEMLKSSPMTPNETESAPVAPLGDAPAVPTEVSPTPAPAVEAPAPAAIEETPAA